jgi:sugar/nucleoside kinase (ribokinase family)
VIKRLVSLGSAIVDLVLQVPRLPDRGGDVLASQRGTDVGGAFNVLSAAARLGLPGMYAGPHGTGPFGDLVRSALSREQIDICRPPTPAIDTGWTIALLEPDGERTFVTVTGADAVVGPDDLRGILYHEGDAVYVSGYDLAYPEAGPAISGHVAGLRRDLTVVFDPGPMAADINPDRLAAVLNRANVLTLNEREVQVLGGVAAVKRELPPESTVIVRRGAAGVTVYAGDQDPFTVPPVKVDVVDTTGAGDVHVGATIAGRAQGMSWPDAILLANRAAAYAVSRPGPAAGPTTAQLEEFGGGRW